MKKIFSILFIFTMIVSCEPSRPDEVIDEGTYEQMFMEFAIINQLDQSLLKNTTSEELRDKVYEHYGVTEEEFRLSHEYYEQHIDEQVDRVKEMTSRLREERDSLINVERMYKEALLEGRLDSLVQEFPDNE